MNFTKLAAEKKTKLFRKGTRNEISTTTIREKRRGEEEDEEEEEEEKE